MAIEVQIPLDAIDKSRIEQGVRTADAG